MKSNIFILLKKIAIGTFLLSSLFALGACAPKEAESVSRELTREEAFKLQVSLSTQYFTEKLRPKQKLEEGENQGGLSFQRKEESIEWSYPKETMTDDQIVQILDVIYGQVPEEKYTPKEGQLTVSQTEKRMHALLQIFLPEYGNPAQTYLSYMGADEESKMSMNAQWMSRMHFDEASNDYSMTIDPLDGALISLERLPKDYFTEEKYANQMNDTGESVQERTDEELVKTMQEYCSTLTEITFILDPVMVINEAASKEASIVMQTDNKEQFTFYIDKSDMTIFRIKNNAKM